MWCRQERRKVHGTLVVLVDGEEKLRINCCGLSTQTKFQTIAAQAGQEVEIIFFAGAKGKSEQITVRLTVRNS